jgi:hypothetical protein
VSGRSENMKKIEVYADWQPGYMGERIPTRRKYFFTLEEAKPTIDEWRKTACTVRVSEVEVMKEYTWGKKKKVK